MVLKDFTLAVEAGLEILTKFMARAASCVGAAPTSPPPPPLLLRTRVFKVGHYTQHGIFDFDLRLFEILRAENNRNQSELKCTIFDEPIRKGLL